MILLALSCDVGLLSSSVMSVFPSISEPSLSLVLPSEPVDVVDDVESLPDTFGLASADELLRHTKQLPIVSWKTIVCFPSCHSCLSCRLTFRNTGDNHVFKLCREAASGTVTCWRACWCAVKKLLITQHQQWLTRANLLSSSGSFSTTKLWCPLWFSVNSLLLLAVCQSTPFVSMHRIWKYCNRIKWLVVTVFKF